MTGIMPLGGTVGCILAGEMLKRQGRRTIFYISDISAILISCLFLINSFYIAIFMRFCMGIIVGINSTVVPLYLREISPVSISGVIVNYHIYIITTIIIIIITTIIIIIIIRSIIIILIIIGYNKPRICEFRYFIRVFNGFRLPFRSI